MIETIGRAIELVLMGGWVLVLLAFLLIPLFFIARLAIQVLMLLYVGLRYLLLYADYGFCRLRHFEMYCDNAVSNRHESFLRSRD